MVHRKPDLSAIDFPNSQHFRFCRRLIAFAAESVKRMIKRTHSFIHFGMRPYMAPTNTRVQFVN